MIQALVIARDKSHQGGVVSFVELLISSFSDKIRATRFIIGRRPDQRSYLGALLITLRDAARLIRSVRTTRYDIIHINPSLNFTAAVRDGLFMTALFVMGVKHIIVFVHGWDVAFSRKIRKNRLARFVTQRLLQRASAILVLARQFKDELCDLGLDDQKIFILTTMFDRKLFEGIQRRRRDSRTRLLFLSRLIKEKGIHELLAAFLLITERVVAIELVIAGDGPEFSTVQKWITAHNLAHQVILVGYLSNQDKAQALADADIFVFPSYTEGCPISLLEAMAAGLPAITTSVGGIPDFFVDDENGVLLKSLSPACMATAIEKLVADKDKQNRIRSRNKQQAWERYEGARVTRTIEGIYEAVIAKDSV